MKPLRPYFRHSLGSLRALESMAFVKSKPRNGIKVVRIGHTQKVSAKLLSPLCSGFGLLASRIPVEVSAGEVLFFHVLSSWTFITWGLDHFSGE